MCGVVGIYHHRTERIVDRTVVEKMRDRLEHRGPDDQGLYAEGAIALGHRRLSILDLEGGHQPLYSDDRKRVIVYNGEVYNFESLRAELEKRGRRFKTTCDTEVVLAMYEEYGTSFVEHLNGMFALAIWDSERERLVLARDRMGIKPLYIHEDEDGLSFASEIKALLVRPGIDTSWDEQGLHDYFQLLYVPSPRTAYASIRQLPPATVLIADAEGVSERKYWNLRADDAMPTHEAIERFTALLADSVDLRTVADVPVGAFLSGGIDSGLIVAFMSRALSEPVRSFTVFDPDAPFYDEREIARLVADRYGTQHEELPATVDAVSLLDEIIPTFDQPFADSGAFPNLTVCRAARSRVKVALSGLGGDEQSAGYVRYLGMNLSRKLEGVPRFIGSMARGLTDLLPEGSGLVFDRAKRFARLVGLSEADAYAAMLSAGGRLGASVLTDEFCSRVDRSSAVDHIGRHLRTAADLGLDPVNRLLYTDMHTYIADDLLPLADRTSMHVGLEVRVPFLDHRLSSHALSIPGSEKVRGRQLKALLKGIARAHLPPEVTQAPKKGFGIPMDDWLRGPLATAMTEAVEHSGPETGILERSTLRRAWEDHQSGRANHEEILWAALVFSRWARQA